MTAVGARPAATEHPALRLRRGVSSLATDRPYAVVVGQDSVTGLQTARLLARRGIPVVGVAMDRTHPGCRTNACDALIEVDTTGPALVAALTQLAQALPTTAVLYPCTDLSVRMISSAQDTLRDLFAIALPPDDTTRMLMDKATFADFAMRHGFPTPPTIVVRDDDDAIRVVTDLRFPAVVKPPIHDRVWDTHMSQKVATVASPEEWKQLYAQAREWAPVLVVQSWIPGGEDQLFSCNAYFDRDAQPVATFVARKLRQWPPDYGTSSLGQEVRNDAVLDTATRLFRTAGFTGLGYVEMKREPGTGAMLIIEPNVGRPTGRSALAETGGVELLAAMYSDQLGLPLPTNLQQQYGAAKWVYLRRDAQAAFHRWRRGELTLRAWASSWRGLRTDAVFALRDQRPFWTDLLRGIAKVHAP